MVPQRAGILERPPRQGATTRLPLPPLAPVLQLLLQRTMPATINARDGDDGATPLHIAAAARDLDSCEALLAAGAARSLDVADANGATPRSLLEALARAGDADDASLAQRVQQLLAARPPPRNSESAEEPDFTLE